MTAAILTLAPYSPPDIAADVREALTPIDREHFEQHLQRASEIVARWPAWKQNLLGGLSTNEPSHAVRGKQKHQTMLNRVVTTSQPELTESDF
jgi:hypothetical protein